jgi:hypothetical protein
VVEIQPLRGQAALAPEGNIRKRLRQFAVETHAEVMGQPTRSPGRNVFKADEFGGFVQELEREGNLRVIQVAPSRGDER